MCVCLPLQVYISCFTQILKVLPPTHPTHCGVNRAWCVCAGNKSRLVALERATYLCNNVQHDYICVQQHFDACTYKCKLLVSQLLLLQRCYAFVPQKLDSLKAIRWSRVATITAASVYTFIICTFWLVATPILAHCVHATTHLQHISFFSKIFHNFFFFFLPLAGLAACRRRNVLAYLRWQVLRFTVKRLFRYKANDNKLLISMFMHLTRFFFFFWCTLYLDLTLSMACEMKVWRIY